jgi:hypothetical protein
MTGRGKAIAFVAALAAWFACAGVASAQEPTVPTLILGGHLYSTPYGNTYVYGHAELPATQDQSGIANQTVQLYASPFPFTAWTQVATLTTDFGGYFSYHTSIGQNMTYRAIWQTTAPVQSKDKLVKLPLKLALKASHTRVKRKGVVTFSGAGRPGHPGAPVELQQADRNGRFKTFAKSVLSAGNTFSVRTRLKTGGLFRMLFPGDGQFGVSVSKPVRVTVTGKRKSSG